MRAKRSSEFCLPGKLFRLLEKLFRLLGKLFRLLGKLFHLLGKLFCLLGKLFRLLGKLFRFFGKLFCVLGILFHVLGKLFHFKIGKYRSRIEWVKHWSLNLKLEPTWTPKVQKFKMAAAHLSLGSLSKVSSRIFLEGRPKQRLKKASREASQGGFKNKRRLPP